MAYNDPIIYSDAYFLDEPFINLDKETTTRLLNYLVGLGSRTLVVLISHEVDVSKFATKTYIVSGGVSEV